MAFENSRISDFQVLVTLTLTHRIVLLLQGRLIGQYCFARWLLSSVVVCNAVGRPTTHAPGGRPRCTADQYGYVPLGRHLVK